MKNSVVIADDHPIFRVGLRHILEQDGRYECIEAEDGSEAQSLIIKHAPDIALLDIKMPVAGGLEVLQKTITQSPHTRFVILTMYDDSKLIERAFDLGGHAYLLKENAESELIHCLRRVLSGHRYLSNSIAHTSINATPATDESIAKLTPAELRIIKFVSEFKTSREIASELSISIRTVQNHRYHINEKLNLNGSNALLHFAVKYFSDQSGQGSLIEY